MTGIPPEHVIDDALLRERYDTRWARLTSDHSAEFQECRADLKTALDMLADISTLPSVESMAAWLTETVIRDTFWVAVPSPVLLRYLRMADAGTKHLQALAALTGVSPLDPRFPDLHQAASRAGYESALAHGLVTP